MATTWDDYNAALTMRDIIRQMVNAEVDKIRPRYEMAEVISIERGFRYCMVRFPGDTEPIKVSMGSIQPMSAGQLVRVEGLIGDRFIADVIGPTYNIANERLDILEDQINNGANLVPNPSYENDYADWSDFWGPVKNNIETSTSHVYAGAKSIRFDFTDPANGAVNQSSVFPCEPGVPVKIMYRVKRSGAGIIDRLEVLSNTTSGGANYFQSGMATTIIIPSYNPGTGWELKQALFTPPAGHYFMRIVSRGFIEYAGEASLWYDDYKAYGPTEKTLDGLDDVTLSSPSNGSLLVYNGTDWVNSPVWQSWTPTLISTGTNPTIGNSTVVGRYLQVGKTVFINMSFVIGSTFAPGTGLYGITNLPVAARTDYWQALKVAATLTTPASGDYTGTAKIEGSNGILRIHIHPNTASSMVAIGGTGSVAMLANGNRLLINGVYEAA